MTRRPAPIAGQVPDQRRALGAVTHRSAVRRCSDYYLPVEGKQARFGELLHALPTGLTEWAVHPGTGSPESRAIDSGRRHRRANYEFLTSLQAREIIHQEGIAMIDYRLLQQAWSRRRAPR